MPAVPAGFFKKKFLLQYFILNQNIRIAQATIIYSNLKWKEEARSPELMNKSFNGPKAQEPSNYQTVTTMSGLDQVEFG